MVSNPALCLKGHGFDSQPGNLKFLNEVVRIFLVPLNSVAFSPQTNLV
jgi:hypothetical protein